MQGAITTQRLPQVALNQVSDVVVNTADGRTARLQADELVGGAAPTDLDAVPDSATRLAMTTAERTKLSGLAATLPNLAALRVISSPAQVGAVYVAGSSAAGDGGAGLWVWYAAATDVSVASWSLVKGNGGTPAGSGHGYNIGNVTIDGTVGPDVSPQWLITSLGSPSGDTNSDRGIAAMTLVSAGRYAVAPATTQALTGSGGAGATIDTIVWVPADDGALIVSPTGWAGPGRWIRVCGDVISARWFGTDNHAIMAALAVPSKTVTLDGYEFTTPGARSDNSDRIVVPDDGVLIGPGAIRVTEAGAGGSGTYAVIVPGNRCTLDGFMIDASAGGIHGIMGLGALESIKIRNMKILVSGNCSAIEGYIGWIRPDIDNITIINAAPAPLLTYTNTNGIKLTGSYRANVRNCDVTDCDTGIYLIQGANLATIAHNRLRGARKENIVALPYYYPIEAAGESGGFRRGVLPSAPPERYYYDGCKYIDNDCDNSAEEGATFDSGEADYAAQHCFTPYVKVRTAPVADNCTPFNVVCRTPTEWAADPTYVLASGVWGMVDDQVAGVTWKRGDGATQWQNLLYSTPYPELIFSQEKTFTPDKIDKLIRIGNTAYIYTIDDHGLIHHPFITVTGADQSEYNVTSVQTTVASPKSLSYPVSGSPATPATGSITLNIVTDPSTILAKNELRKLANGTYKRGTDETIFSALPTIVPPTHYRYKVVVNPMFENKTLWELVAFTAHNIKYTVLGADWARGFKVQVCNGAAAGHIARIEQAGVSGSPAGRLLVGYGSPEGHVVGVAGEEFVDLNGADNDHKIYLKSGSDNTGWAAQAATTTPTAALWFSFEAYPGDVRSSIAIGDVLMVNLVGQGNSIRGGSIVLDMHDYRWDAGTYPYGSGYPKAGGTFGPGLWGTQADLTIEDVNVDIILPEDLPPPGAMIGLRAACSWPGYTQGLTIQNNKIRFVGLTLDPSVLTDIGIDLFSYKSVVGMTWPTAEDKITSRITIRNNKILGGNSINVEGCSDVIIDGNEFTSPVGRIKIAKSYNVAVGGNYAGGGPGKGTLIQPTEWAGRFTYVSATANSGLKWIGSPGNTGRGRLPVTIPFSTYTGPVSPTADQTVTLMSIAASDFKMWSDGDVVEGEVDFILLNNGPNDLTTCNLGFYVNNTAVLATASAPTLAKSANRRWFRLEFKVRRRSASVLDAIGLLTWGNAIAISNTVGSFNDAGKVAPSRTDLNGFTFGGADWSTGYLMEVRMMLRQASSTPALLLEQITGEAYAN